MGALFLIHRSNRTEQLVAALAELLEEPPADPLRPELIAVQSLGLRTWLGQALARRLGVWANAEFPFPRELIQGLIAAVLGEDPAGADPYQGDSLTWAVLASLPGLLAEEAFRPLGDYLGPEDPPLKRYQLARRIAEVFDQYTVHRPDLLLDWERGGPRDWQAQLWRAVRERLGGEPLPLSWRRFDRALAKRPGSAAGLPARISLFGISSLPPLYLDVLARLPAPTEVHLFLLAPTREFFGHLPDPGTIDRLLADRELEPEDVEADLHLEEGPALLGSLGRVGREFQLLLERGVDYHEPDEERFVDPEGDGDRSGDPSLLELLQADVFHLRRRPSSQVPRAALAPGDGSLLLHACHSPVREVEALHERLRQWFEEPAEPRLEPHQVIVMAPDIEAYAPLIEAVFSSPGDAAPIPYSISDRSLRYDSTVVEAFSRLLELATSRLGLQEVFDLLGLAPVREQFGLTADDLERVQHWVQRAGVRWGIDAEHRRALGQPPFEQNSWRFGLDRLLLGVALPGDEQLLYGGCLPADEVEGQSAELLGRLAEFCDRLFGGLQALGTARDWPGWQQLLGDLLHGLIASRRDNAHQHQQVREALAGLVDEARRAGWQGPVTLEVVQAALAERFAQTRSARGFLSGGVTFCSLLPMRSIPFRVVCLLGMNDGDFPRAAPTLGFDRVAQQPRLGDRQPRHSDRYLFLEAMLAARERLLISYVGQSIQDNSPLPPAVVISELLDVITEGFTPASADPIADPTERRRAMERRLVVHLPLQPFSPRCFGAGDDPRLGSHQRDAFEGARALQGRQRPAPAFLDEPLPPPAARPEEVRLDDLKRFFRQPAAFLLARRLGADLDAEPSVPPAREPLEPDALERHRLGSWLLERAVRTAGPPGPEDLAVLRAKGALPPGTPGQRLFEDLAAEISLLLEASGQLIRGRRLAPREVELDLGPIRLAGRLTELWPRAQARLTFGQARAGRLLGLWIDHLALLCLQGDDLPRTSCLIARKMGSRGPFWLTGAGDDPRRLLADLAALYLDGLQRPLRFFPGSAWAFARRMVKDGQDTPAVRRSALADAYAEWRATPYNDGEQDDPAVRRVFAGREPLEEPAGDGEPDFASLALRVFGPLLASLVRGSQP